MRMRQFLCLGLLSAALLSGGVVFWERLRFLQQWQTAPVDAREGMLLGELRPVVAKVKKAVPPAGSILLFSGIDPALIPYYLHPRKIWQTQTEPETNAVYMDLPASPYPRLRPEEFRVTWHLYCYPGNMRAGGELVYVDGERGGR